MKDFVFRNDTRLFFRNDIRETVAEVAKGQKVMFIYGGGSVDGNGCRHDVVTALADAESNLWNMEAPRASSRR